MISSGWWFAELYRFSNSRMISNFWGPWLFKDNIKALILMWGVFIQLCFYALYEAHANHLQKKSEWQFLLLFLHWTLSSSIIACAMGMWFTKPLDLPLPFFSFQLHTHLNGWGWQWLSDKRETLKKRMAFLIFFFFCFDSYDLPPPSHYSHPDGCRCHSHRLENYSSYLKKKNYFGHDGMSFLFFFLKKKRGGNFGHLYLSAKPIYLPRRVRLSLLSSVLFGEDGRNWKYLWRIRKQTGGYDNDHLLRRPTRQNKQAKQFHTRKKKHKQNKLMACV